MLPLFSKRGNTARHSQASRNFQLLILLYSFYPTQPFQRPIFAMATAQPEKKKERPSALRSIIAGSTAGAVEIGMSHLPDGSRLRR